MASNMFPFVSEITVETAEPLKLKHAFGDKYLHLFPQICKMSSFVSTSTGYVEYHHCAMGFCHKQTAFSAAHINHRVAAMSPLNASGRPTKIIHDSERCFIFRTKKQNIGISRQNMVCAVFFLVVFCKYLQGRCFFAVNHL